MWITDFFSDYCIEIFSGLIGSALVTIVDKAGLLDKIFKNKYIKILSALIAVLLFIFVAHEASQKFQRIKLSKQETTKKNENDPKPPDVYKHDPLDEEGTVSPPKDIRNYTNEIIIQDRINAMVALSNKNNATYNETSKILKYDNEKIYMEHLGHVSSYNKNQSDKDLLKEFELQTKLALCYIKIINSAIPNNHDMNYARIKLQELENYHNQYTEYLPRLTNINITAAIPEVDFGIDLLKHWDQYKSVLMRKINP